MIDTCYVCCEQKELTKEHIIPNCIGGFLKEPIYCSYCNNQLGKEVDDEIARTFGRYATLMGIERERGENQPFVVNDENSGLELYFDGKKFIRKNPVVKPKKFSKEKHDGFEVIASTEKDLKKITSGIIKKNKIDLSLVTFDRPQHKPPVANHEIVISNEIILKAVAKIAYGFACFKLPKPTVLSSAFSKIRCYLKNELSEKMASPNYEHTDFMSDRRRPLHKIHLSYNRNERLLVGYVALFGVFRYTVLLSDSLESNFDWGAIDYTCNPVTRREVPANLSFNAPALTKDQVLNPKESGDKILNELQIGMKVIAEYSQGMESIDVDCIY